MKRPCEMSKDEHRVHCNERAKLWRKNNPEKARLLSLKCRESGRRWAVNNKEHHKQLVKAWNLKNKERIRQKRLVWQRVNSQKRNISFKKWRDKNKERERARFREYYLKHKSELVVKKSEYNLKNKIGLTVKRKARYERLKHDPSYVSQNRNIQHRRRARIKSSIVGDITAIRRFVASVYSSPRVTCYYCKSKLRGSKAHIDHVIPIAKGGAHEVGNLCCSCPPCNQSKSAKLPSNFIVNGQAMLCL